jgi:LysM repeat protein
MAIEYWLISGKEKLRLPVNPESFNVSSPFNYEDMEVEGLGDVTNIGYRGLKEFTIPAFWPLDYNPAYCNYSGFPSPDTFVATIERWRNARAPIRCIVTGIKSANTLVTIREFQYEQEKAGSPGDVYFTLTLKEFRQSKMTVVDTAKPKPKPPTKSRPPAPAKVAPKTYTVKKDDCLWKIAKRLYGDGAKWPKIYAVNKKLIGKNPNRIYPGQKLVIPK